MIMTAVRVFEPYLLEVVFDNGEVRRVDFQPILHGQMFEPLRDPALFAPPQVDPVLGTVVWPNSADLSPEFLYASDASTTGR